MKARTGETPRVALDQGTAAIDLRSQHGTLHATALVDCQVLPPALVKVPRAVHGRARPQRQHLGLDAR